MARTKQTVKKTKGFAQMRPVSYTEFRRSHERSSSTSSPEEARPDHLKRQHMSRTERIRSRQRVVQQKLQNKLTVLYGKVKGLENLADDILDLSHEAEDYDIPLCDFSNRTWNQITTVQYALESLQLWLDLGMEVKSKPNTSSSSESESEVESPQKIEAEKSIFEITSSSEEETNN